MADDRTVVCALLQAISHMTLSAHHSQTILKAMSASRPLHLSVRWS
ncbi:MAG: hypothetical protein P8N61_08110 [Porticoccaceae bacterium]|nr:hypothetical protein [Porticoccaceae bacterium]